MDQSDFNRRAIPRDAVIRFEPAADGWPLRVFDWAGGKRGTVIFCGGRGDIIEKYIESFAHWHEQGWTVRSTDWRGQGGSGRLSADPHIGHVEDFSIWIDDFAAQFSHAKANLPGPHVIIAHSMGGHLITRALVEKRITPDAVILIAPMLGVRSAPFTPWIAAKIARFMARIGNPERAAWKDNERPSLPGASRQKYLTHSDDRYADEIWWKEQYPGLTLGPASWQWVAAAYRSTLDSFLPGRLESIDTPVFILCADKDRLVSVPAIREAAQRIPGARISHYSGESSHEILREIDPVRGRALREIDSFLDDKAPPR